MFCGIFFFRYPYLNSLLMQMNGHLMLLSNILIHWPKQPIMRYGKYNISFERDACYAAATHVPLKLALASDKGVLG